MKPHMGTKKNKIIALIAAALIIAAVLTVTVIIPENNYRNACSLYEEGMYGKAIEEFEALGGYKDSIAYIGRCENAILEESYLAAFALEQDGLYAEAAEAYGALGAYKDSAQRKDICSEALLSEAYTAALELMEKGELSAAAEAFLMLGGYGDSEAMQTQCENEIAYLAAQELLNSKEYLAAAQAFDALEDYNNSGECAAQCRYLYAKALMDAEDYENAAAVFAALGDYSDSAVLAGSCRAALVNIGDIITLGHYEQDNDTGNGTEAIEWIVLDKDGDRLYLISRYVLDCKVYNPQNISTTATWEDCELRRWLNSEFLETAFSAGEQTCIQTSGITPGINKWYYGAKSGGDTEDKLFLLSAEEAELYFGTDTARMCAPTAYAASRGAKENPSAVNSEGLKCCWWWLRTPGDSNLHATAVYPYGVMNYKGLGLNYNETGVRPAMWISLSE